MDSYLGLLGTRECRLSSHQGAWYAAGNRQPGEHAVQLDYGMVDADNHYYEPTDALTRYLPDERRRDVYWVSEVDTGRKRLVIGSRVWEYLANPTFDPIV